MHLSARVISIGVFVALALLTLLFGTANAQSASELASQIADHNAQIDVLNKEIAEYERQLAEVGAKKNTLQNTLTQLDLQRKKLTASIKATQNKVSSLQLEIQALSRNIAGKENAIEMNKAGLAESLRRLSEEETMTLVESVLASEDLNTIWTDMDTGQMLQKAVREDIQDLSAQKESLSETKTATVQKQGELLKQKSQLVAQQGSLDATRKAQNDLLLQTKSQESNYQKILTEKQAAKANFEAALSDLQSKLQYIIDPSQIPTAGKGILAWPVDGPRITQYFGNTAFALAGAYAGKGHNGIDIGVRTGTPLKVALSGVVLGTGNTDAVRGCYSYGKWVMVKHPNGLATLYAHLSQINVSTGEAVSRGQVLGYSGATGYATGPHLHFGVYVASSVQIIRLGEATNRTTSCSSAVMPVAPLSGYLDPMKYL